MNEREQRDSPDSSRRGHGSEFEGSTERRGGKSLFQLALEVEHLLDKHKLRNDLDGIRIRTRYIE